MIEIRSGRLEPQSGTGQRTTARTFYFDREIRDCWVALTGYSLGYTSDDHHVKTISVDVSAAVEDTESGSGVVVKATLLLRDKNGDDQFRGWADFLLFVDLGRLRVDTGGEREPVVQG
jgi:hypothetical protein